MNRFKLGFINTLLGESNSILGNDYLPFEGFQEPDSDDVPLNSDVVLILSQYLQCFEKLRADNVVHTSGSWHWSIDGAGDPAADRSGRIYIPTVKPRRLRD